VRKAVDDQRVVGRQPRARRAREGLSAARFGIDRLLLVVERPDRLRRVFEGGIAPVDLDHRQQRGERPLERHQIAQLLLDHVADHAFGFRTEDVEGISFHLGVGGALQRQQADLRAVAVADDQLVLARHRRERLSRDADVAALVFGAHRLAAFQQCVAAKGCDDEHGAILL
jgi:hypothetical protein